MPQLLLILSPLFSMVAVEVTQLNGTRISGELVRWDNTQLTVQTEDAFVELSTEQLLGITFRESSKRPGKPPADKLLTLRCGTRVPLVAYTAQDGRAQLRLRNEVPPLEIDVSQIRSVRFNPPSAALDKQWQELTKQQHQGDVLVIRKSNEALDYLEGIIGNVTSDQLSFELDEDRLDVALSKLEGIIPFGTSTGSPSAMCRLTTSDGATWHIDQANLQGDQLALRTPTGLATKLPLASLEQISFASGNVQYISDLDPVSAKTTPFITGDATPASVTRLLYAFRRNESLRGTPLMLANGDGGRQIYQKGLAIHSQTQLQYRLDGGFRKLRGICGIDPAIRSPAEVTLQIFADDQPVLDLSLSSGDDPVTIDVSIEGARRLKLVVDYADGSDIGDHLNLCNLRATK